MKPWILTASGVTAGIALLIAAAAGGYALGTTPDPRGTALVLATIVAMALLLGSAIVIAVYTVVALVGRHIHRAVGEVDERVGTYQDGVETTIGRLAEALPKPGLRRIS